MLVAMTETRFSSGKNEDWLTDYAWILLNSKGRAHQVRSKRPNAWGLFDMHGNIDEWSNDMSSSGQTEKCGGLWNSYARGCKSASRSGPQDSWRRYGGFRVAFFPANQARESSHKRSK